MSYVRILDIIRYNNISFDSYYNRKLKTYIKYELVTSYIRNRSYYLDIRILIFFNFFFFFTFYFINKHI